VATSTASARRRALDPRLLIGVGLVVASVAGVLGLVAAIDRRVVVFAASTTIAPGDTVDRADLVERTVSLAEADGLYLGADDVPGDGLVAVRTLPEGELVPLSAVGDPVALATTTIVVETAGRLSSGARTGSAVELWAAPADADGRGFGAPVVIVGDAVVVRLVEGDGLMVGTAGEAVEVRVPRDKVARILQAQADGDALAVVPAGSPLRVG